MKVAARLPTRERVVVHVDSRKFHALGDRRYVMLSLTQVLPLLFVLLSLEFMPRRRNLS